MKYDRKALLEKVEERIEAMRKAHESETVKYERLRTDSEREWKLKRLPQVKALAAAFERAVDDKELVTDDWLSSVLSKVDPAGEGKRNRGYYSGPSLDGLLYHPPSDRMATPSKKFQVPERLAQLKALLELVTDDEISSSALRDAGIKDLRGLL